MSFFSCSYFFLLLASFTLVAAQTVTPLSIDGYLTGLSVKNPADPRSGGSITVNGISITVPDNLLVNFPAAFIPFAQLGATPNYAGDVGPPEVSVIGNVVNGQAIAGIIDLAQPLAQFSQGAIESITNDPPSIKIKGGPVIKINDPGAVYSKGNSDRPFFTADDENPSISSFQGFPMCIPRVAGVDADPLCPSSNRPKADNTMPDATVMMPFQVGDFIDYSGVTVGGAILCHTIVANIQVVSSNPGYIRMEDALIGIIDNDANVAFSQSKFIGFTTDPSGVIDINAIDVDPCTGVETNRVIQLNVGIDAGAVRNRFRYLTDRLPIGQYTREYHVSLHSGTVTTKNGILAGQYHQPVTEWVFPELTAIGAAPPPNDFSQISHLANGFGPFVDDYVFGQLNPWPGRFPAPSPSKACPDRVTPPAAATTTAASTATAAPAVVITADAGADVTVRPGTQVVLTGKQTSAGIDTTALSYSWAQTAPAGEQLALTNGKTASATVVVPTQGTTGVVARTFELTVTHSSGVVSKDSIVVTSSSDAAVKDKVVIDGYSRSNSGGGTITVAAHSDLVADPSALMLISVGGAAYVNMVKQGTGTGKWSYSTTGVKVNTPIAVKTRIGTVDYGTAARTAPSKRTVGVEFTG